MLEQWANEYLNRSFEKQKAKGNKGEDTKQKLM